jgi:hypothetical protein
MKVHRCAVRCSVRCTTARADTSRSGASGALRGGNTNFCGTDAIVFSAGPGNEAHGLIGTLTPTG